MPVERRSGSKQIMAIGIGVAALAIAILAAWGLLHVAGGDASSQLRLGDDVFDAGNAVRLSKQIKKDGPLLFSDVSGRGQLRPIAVNHFGDDPEVRWVAFDAVAPDAPENCFLAWNEDRSVFEERSVADGEGRSQGEICRAEVTYPENGEGLNQYPWKIDDAGVLTIDLRPDDDVTVNGGG